ncbi:hypothetical protein C8Q79DRAFT_622346 [Trametes meyenii]|nr:hypothetical protein C8Q79DRAFT_622346 [Trametes meyenii]
MAHYGFRDGLLSQQQDTYSTSFQQYDYGDVSPYHSPREDYGHFHDDVDALLAEIANSSPSPPDRSSRTRAPTYAQTSLPNFSRHTQPQVYPASLLEAQDQEMQPQYNHEVYQPGPSFDHPDVYASPPASRVPPYQTSVQDDDPYGFARSTVAAPVSRTNAYNDQSPQQSTRNWHGTRLRPVSDLRRQYRRIPVV